MLRTEKKQKTGKNQSQNWTRLGLVESVAHNVTREFRMSKVAKKQT